MATEIHSFRGLSQSEIETRRKQGLGNDILHFTLPASFTIFVFGLLIYIGAFFLIQNNLTLMTITPEMITQLEKVTGVTAGTMTSESFQANTTLLAAQTALLIFFVLSGLLVMIFAEPPFAWFAGGSEFHGRNWLPLFAALGLLLGFGVIYTVPSLRDFFQLVPLPPFILYMILILTIIWAFIQRFLWRSRWLEKFLDVERDR